MELINVIVAAVAGYAFGAVWYMTLSKQWVEAAGIEECILYFNVGNKPHGLVKEQMHKFMDEVAPNFSNYRIAAE